jgi:hypothetical protein
LALFIRLPLEKAAIWSLLGGYMLLPSNLTVDVPFLPPVDKMSITAIATLLLCWMKGSKAVPAKRSVLVYVFAGLFVVAPVLTTINNSYELQTAGKSVPGFYPLDGVKFALRNMMILIPFYVGSRTLSTDSARLYLIKVLPSAMLFYSLPMLAEVRLSPQIHAWVYGYLPTSFDQQVRGGGFRPVVFFPHGLTLALFTGLCLLAALVAVRGRWRILTLPPGLAASYLGGLLILCKSLGPVIYSIILAPIILFTKPRLWVQVGCAISLFVCAYPFLRGNGLTPIEMVSNLAQSVSTERNESFQTRVGNEHDLLAKANEKPWFGWGGFGRNRIFDKWTGKDISITDGGWIIEFGAYGWFGYLSFFGLLCLAQFRALRGVGREVSQASIARAGLALLLAVYVLDQIPNGGELPLVFLLGGAISSSAGAVRRNRARQSADTAEMSMAVAVPQ